MSKIKTEPLKVRLFEKSVGPVVRFTAAAEGEECYDDIGSDWNFIAETTVHVPVADAGFSLPPPKPPSVKMTAGVSPLNKLHLTCPSCGHQWDEPLSRMP